MSRPVREGAVSAHRADQAFEDLLDLRVPRYPHFVPLCRIWELRDNLSLASFGRTNSTHNRTTNYSPISRIAKFGSVSQIETTKN